MKMHKVMMMYVWPFRKEFVSLGDIERIHKKRRHDKESRLATVMVSDKNVVTLLRLLKKVNFLYHKKSLQSCSLIFPQLISSSFL